MANLLEKLEKRFTEIIGIKHAVVTSSGRLALEIAFKTTGIKGRVIIPNLTCSVVPYTLLKTGSIPLITDIRNDLSLDIEYIEPMMGNDCVAIMPNYLYGCPTDNIRNLIEFANHHDQIFIEDAAQAFGAHFESRWVGSFGCIGIFSFPKLFFNLFRGGVLTTNDDEIAEKARELRGKLQRNVCGSTLALISKKYKLKGKLKNKIKSLTIDIINKNPSRHDNEIGLGNLRPPYHIYDKSYHYEHLTDVEINIVIKTLNDIYILKTQRLELVKIIYDKISKFKDLEPLYPYNEKYVYTRIPIVLRSKNLAQWMAFFEGRGIHIDAVYAPLSGCEYLRRKCDFYGDYNISLQLAQQILPLPVNEKVIDLLS